LPDRELASGIAEVVKYGLIRDPDLFVWLEENMEKLVGRDPAALAFAIKRSCENKVGPPLICPHVTSPQSSPVVEGRVEADCLCVFVCVRQAAIVALDEREGEAGIRATLNLGHTFGHAVETGLGYGTWLHGEAVAVGMVMAVDLSARLGWVEPELKGRVVRLLQRAKLPTALPKGSGMTLRRFQETMSIDKKVADGVLRLILLKGELGKCLFTADYDPRLLNETIEAFCKE
jgi:3-dehydroquinate synthase